MRPHPSELSTQLIRSPAVNTPDKHLKNASLVMKVIGWACLVGLPASAFIYPPGILWGSVPLEYCFPAIGPAHPPSPYNGLHPYFFMLVAMYVSYGFLMIRGARDPKRNVALFDYGIVSSIVHGGIMIPQAFFYPNEHAHLWADIPFAGLVIVVLWIFHPDRGPSRQAA
jgi:hypothetical protein